jgi:O-succinylbenzoic acid--CoA ligase
MVKLEAHDIVGISSTNGPADFLTKYKSVKATGATPLLLPPVKSEDLLKPYFEQCKPNVLWLDDDICRYSNSEIFKFEEPTTLFFTSGSTSSPKVVVHSDHNLELSAQESLAELGIVKSIHIVTPLPLWHVGGLLCYYRSLYLNSELILTNKQRIISDLNKHARALVILVPAQIDSLIQESIDHSQHIFYLGGGRINDQLIQNIKKYNLNCIGSYGMTETAGAIATGIKALTPMTGTSINTDQNDRLLVNTSRNAKYYIIENKLTEIPHKDNYIETSDIGLKSNNEFVVSGRIDQVFISGGENISPMFLEKLIREIDINIIDVKVIGHGHKRLENEIIVFLSPYKDETIKDIIKDLPHTIRPHRVLPWPDHNGIKPTLKDFQDKVDNNE